MQGEATVAKVYGGALVMEVVDEGSGMMYRGSELLYLVIMLRVAKSFADKPK
jgi:hypothetical protein